MKDYKLFVEENNNHQENENDKVKIEYESSTYNIELSQNKVDTFLKLIKNATKYCKQMGIPQPIVNNLPDKKYYILGSTFDDFDSDKQISYYKDTLTDNQSEILNFQKDYQSKNTKSRYAIYETTVFPKTITIVDKIKPNDEWIILGVIDHVEGILKAAPNQQVPFNLIPSDLHSSYTCDHCNTQRIRNKTVFIQNLSDNKIIRVGGSCIKYYLGYNYEAILQYITQLSIFQTYNNSVSGGDFDEDDYFGGGNYGGHIVTLVDLKNCVKYFSWYVKHHGYKSKKSVETINAEKDENDIMVQSTSNVVTNTINYISEEPRKDIDTWLEECKKFNVAVESENDDFYNMFVTYVEDNYKENNFLFNVLNFIKDGSVTLKYVSYVIGACSMLQGKISYENFKLKKSENEKESNWIGTIGEKIKLENLTIKHVTGYEGQWGWVSIFKLEDENGNIFTRFGDIPEKFLVEGTEVIVGSKVSFIAEIKNHDTFNNKKQTVLGRLSTIKK